MPAEGEIEPTLEDGEYVVFAAHFDQGFALPVSSFTNQFFTEFKMQPHHLPANAFTTMSSFVPSAKPTSA